MYLYKLTTKLTRGSAITALIVVLLYGFGVGALNTTIYLRMYSMATCIAIIFAYYSFELFENRKNNDKKKISCLLGLIFFSCFLGSFTLHLFLVYAFGITICYTLYYLISRNWKRIVLCSGCRFIFYGFSVDDGTYISVY